MNKLDKLREVCTTLDEIIIKKETYIFIENISSEDNKKIKEPQPKVIADAKLVI